MTSTSELNSFFYPSSVCVIGATENPSKLGFAITQNVLENTYQHYSPYFVSHTQTRVFDHPVYKSILDIPNPIELAIVLVPAKFVPNIVNDCIQKAVKAIIIVTAGFGEMGVEGKNIEADLATKCRSAGIRLIGPNCVGIENIPYGLNASSSKNHKWGELV